MAKLLDRTGALSPEAQKAHHPALAERVARTRGDLSKLPARYVAAARVVQHMLAHESIPQPLAAQVQKELAVGRAARAVLISL